MDRPTQLKSYH